MRRSTRAGPIGSGSHRTLRWQSSPRRTSGFPIMWVSTSTHYETPGRRRGVVGRCEAPVPSPSKCLRICSSGPGGASFAKALKPTSPSNSSSCGANVASWRSTSTSQSLARGCSGSAWRVSGSLRRLQPRSPRRRLHSWPRCCRIRRPSAWTGPRPTFVSANPGYAGQMTRLRANGLLSTLDGQPTGVTAGT